MPWLRAEELASCWHGSICGFLAKTLQDQTRNQNNVYWWRNGPHRQLYRCPPTTWNYRSGLQIVPRGWASPHLLRRPLTWSVWLTHREETWCRGTWPKRFQNTLCYLFRGTSRDRERSPPVIFHVALCYRVWHFFVFQPPSLTYDLHFFF